MIERSKGTQLTVNADELTPEALKPMATQNNLSRGTGRLLAVAEAYPDLKADENFLKHRHSSRVRRIGSPPSVCVLMIRLWSTIALYGSYVVYLLVCWALMPKPTSSGSRGLRVNQ